MSKRADFVPLLQVEKNTMEDAGSLLRKSENTPGPETVTNRAYRCASQIARALPLALLLALLIVCAVPGLYRTEYRLQLGDRDGNNMKLEVDTRVLSIHVRRTVLPCMKPVLPCCLPIWQAHEADECPRAVCASP